MICFVMLPPLKRIDRMKCKKCDNTGVVEVFSDDWPANCDCKAGDKLEIARLEKENKKLWEKHCLNVEKINSLV